MNKTRLKELLFESKNITAQLIDPDGQSVKKRIQIRKNPITGRTSRITFSRIQEMEAGAQSLPKPPPGIENTSTCPFCKPQIEKMTPMLSSLFGTDGRMKKGKSVLFPNLFPYGTYSAVSLLSDAHFVEIGKADAVSYTNCLLNCRQYLEKVQDKDPSATFMAITQNHLPSAGGSLVHPHLQVHADTIAANNHFFLKERAGGYWKKKGSLMFGDYAAIEKRMGDRYIGSTGPWEWMAAFAPEGFFEIWGIYPEATTLFDLAEKDLYHLAQGIIFTQKFYRSLNRNGYNLGILWVQNTKSALELKVSLVVRSNYDQWVRSDHTGFEVMLGDMATFILPEKTAELAKPFWLQTSTHL